MNKELINCEELGMVTIKKPDCKEFIYRFIKWKRRDEFEDIVNSKRIFRIGEESFPVRSFEKIEKFNGEIPNKNVLDLLNRKIQKYRSTFFRNPGEIEINQMTKNAKKEIKGI